MSLPKHLRKSSPWQLRMGERRTLLLVGDFLVALIALLVALYFWGSVDRFPTFSWEFLVRRPPVWFYLLPVFWLVLLVELYNIHSAGDWGATVRGVAAASLIGIMLYLVLFFYYVDPPRNLLPRRGVAGFFVAAVVLTLAWRAVYIRVFTAPQFMRRVLLVGGGTAGVTLLRVINDLWPPPFFIVGIVDDDPQKAGQTIENFPVLGTSDHLRQLVAEQNITDMVVAISGEMQGKMFQALLEAQERGVEIVRFPRAYEDLLDRVPIRLLEADWILRSFVDQAQPNGFYELAKRLLDIVGGLVGVVILLIILPFAAIAIVLDDGFPIFYAQTRSGRGAQLYNIIKLRTMRRNAEADGRPKWAKEDDERATRVGRYLRKSHLDELPQFLNVLRGEMSLVGPRAERPELMAMFEKHVPFYRGRLMVKPGITGWAQINFGYAATIEETIVKLEYDLYYIKHRNIMLDLMILLRTPATMLGLRGR
jgi:exopolysaccharide biosynthesis polyprenyl glycosylphosphotransferase